MIRLTWSYYGRKRTAEQLLHEVTKRFFLIYTVSNNGSLILSLLGLSPIVWIWSSICHEWGHDEI
jgi:hypothetical protein